MGTERWLRWLPFGLLALASLVAVVASPEMGDDVAADVPLALGIAALTAVWMLVTPSPGPLNYIGRTALAFVLCWLNPLYAIFGFFGFIVNEVSILIVLCLFSLSIKVLILVLVLVLLILTPLSAELLQQGQVHFTQAILA